MKSIPSGHVRVCVYIVMLIDVGGRLPARRIAGDRLRIWILVDSNVIESHSCWQEWSDAREVKGSERGGHAKIQNDGHWLLWDDSLPNVAVWPDCVPSDSPSCVLANKPRDVTIATRSILESIDLVRIAVVPLVVNIGNA